MDDFCGPHINKLRSIYNRLEIPQERRAALDQALTETEGMTPTSDFIDDLTSTQEDVIDIREPD